MAVLYITELYDVGKSHTGGPMQIAKMPPIAEQTVAIGASTALSAPLNVATRFVRISTDVACALSFGSNTNLTANTATTTGISAPGSLRMAGNTTEYFEVGQGVTAAGVSTPATPSTTNRRIAVIATT